MKISHLIDIKDRYFKEKGLLMDGYRFINCMFDSCDLLWTGTHSYGVLRCTFRYATAISHIPHGTGRQLKESEIIKNSQPRKIYDTATRP